MMKIRGKILCKQVQMSRFLIKKNHLDYINLGMKYDFTAILISLMNYSLEEINSKEEMKTEEGEKYFAVANALFAITRSYSNYSVKFCHEFHSLDGIKIAFKYLKDSYIVKNYKFTRIIVGSLL